MSECYALVQMCSNPTGLNQASEPISRKSLFNQVVEIGSAGAGALGSQPDTCPTGGDRLEFDVTKPAKAMLLGVSSNWRVTCLRVSK